MASQASIVCRRVSHAQHIRAANGQHSRCQIVKGAPHTASRELDSCLSWRRILSGHEAEELLLRAVVAPTAERCLALCGLDEPRYQYRGGGASTPAVAASGDPRPQDLLDELVVIAAVVASGFLQVGPQHVQKPHINMATFVHAAAYVWCDGRICQ